MATKKDEEEARPGTEQGIGELDPSIWDEQPAVTGRPNDLGNVGELKPALENSTLASRAKARTTADRKAVKSSDTEDKAVSSSRTARKS